MDDYIVLAIPKIQYQLHHVANAIMTGIHYVFSLYKANKEDDISLKKILKKEAVQATIKNVLGFEFDVKPGEHTIWPTEDSRTDILTKLRKWIREGGQRKKGIPFEEFRTYPAKLRYAFITISAENDYDSRETRWWERSQIMSSYNVTNRYCRLSVIVVIYQKCQQKIQLHARKQSRDGPITQESTMHLAMELGVL